MPVPAPLRVSLILTLRDEAVSLPALLESIAGQTRAADEIVVVDGGSSDATPAILGAWQSRLPLRVEVVPGANIAAGRNRALELTRGDVVAVTDGGVRLLPNWLARLVAPFEGDGDEAGAPDVVAGFFRPDATTLFEQALAAVTLPDAQEIDGPGFLPSSRSVAFRRSLFAAGFRYPGWLDYGEDLVFDLRLRHGGARFHFQPEAVVWFRPRPSAAAYFRQYFRYARGDGKAGLFAPRHLLRYLTYLVALPLGLSRGRSWARLALLGAGGLYMRPPWLRLWRRGVRGPTLVPLLALTAILRAEGDLAKMLGYPLGLWWRACRYGLRRGWPDIPEPASGASTGGLQALERLPEELRRP